MPINGVKAGAPVPRLGRKRANTLEDAMPSVSLSSHTIAHGRSLQQSEVALWIVFLHRLACVVLLHDIA